MTYQCDVMVIPRNPRQPKHRCQRAASWVGERNGENWYFCDSHMPGDWSRFAHVYVIDQGGEMVETGITKEELAVPVPKNFVKAAVELRFDRIVASHAWGIAWDPPRPEELTKYEQTLEKAE